MGGILTLTIWNLKKRIKIFYPMSDNVFFAYRSPEKCKDLEVPKSQVNVMRFIANCIYNNNLEFLNDNQYVTRYETHPDYGKVYPY